jgi:Phosphotransferase enzyme family
MLGLLDARGVASYLTGRGLIAREAEPHVRVSSVSRRNYSLIVSVDGEPTWFVKQIQHPVPEVVESLRREAMCYHFANHDSVLSSLAALMPRCALYDPCHAILVMEYLRGVNGAEAHQVVGPWDAEVAGMIGACLGTLHAFWRAAYLGRRHLPQQLPWVLALPDPAQRGGRAAVLSVFNADREAAVVLMSLRRKYRFSTLIHGDARLENFMLVEPAANQGVKELRLVDWELADIGDPAWDIACVLQHYAVRHVWLEKPGTAPVLPHAAFDGFWAAYEAARGPLPPGEGRLAMCFTGARLIQNAYEHSVAGEAAQARVDRIRRLAHLLLTRPDAPRDAPWP